MTGPDSPLPSNRINTNVGYVRYYAGEDTGAPGIFSGTGGFGVFLGPAVPIFRSYRRDNNSTASAGVLVPILEEGRPRPSSIVSRRTTRCSEGG
jgi:hypothetical protein